VTRGGKNGTKILINRMLKVTWRSFYTLSVGSIDLIIYVQTRCQHAQSLGNFICPLMNDEDYVMTNAVPKYTIKLVLLRRMKHMDSPM
jgi:hypothetical protein